MMRRLAAVLAAAPCLVCPCLAMSQPPAGVTRPASTNTAQSADAKGADAEVTNKAPKPRSVFSRNDLVLMGAFVAGATAAAMHDVSLDTRMQASTVQSSGTLHTLANSASMVGQPGALILTTGLLAGGRLFNNYRVSEAGLHATEAVLLSALTTSVLKTAIGRARPYVGSPDPGESGPDADVFRFGGGFGQDYTSFPSGHTTVAFAAASALTRELFDANSSAAWIAGPLLYGAATAVGLSRVYKNKHWASDVIAGAAVGTFIGNKVVAYKHSRRANRFERLLLPNVGASPTGNLSLNWSLTTR